MPNAFDDALLDQALREGLRAQPVPVVSPDFDARILATVCVPVPWWQRVWQPAKPLLAGTSFSLVMMLALLHWTLSAPLTLPAAPAAFSQTPALASSGPMPSVDALLDRPGLSAGSLAAFWNDSPTTPPTDRRPEPHRHAQIRRQVCPIA